MMTAIRESMKMAQNHDLHHESHHGQCPPHYMNNKNSHNIHNPINFYYDNHTFYVNLGSRLDTVKNKGDKTNTKGKNVELEIY